MISFLGLKYISYINELKLDRNTIELVVSLVKIITLEKSCKMSVQSFAICNVLMKVCFILPLIRGESETAEVLNNIFSNIVKKLKILEYENLNSNFENIKDSVFRAIVKYKNHPSIIAINEKSKNAKFSFHEVNNEKIAKEIRRLNKNKASQKSDIPIRIIKENADIFAEFLCETVNSAIKSSNFPNSLKLADITPLHKKGRKDNKENYRPVGILPTLSKIFERILFEQM